MNITVSFPLCYFCSPQIFSTLITALLKLYPAGSIPKCEYFCMWWFFFFLWFSVLSKILQRVCVFLYSAFDNKTRTKYRSFKNCVLYCHLPTAFIPPVKQILSICFLNTVPAALILCTPPPPTHSSVRLSLFYSGPPDCIVAHIHFIFIAEKFVSSGFLFCCRAWFILNVQHLTLMLVFS